MVLTSRLGQYALITGNYWVFTLTDGGLRMLVVLHFHQLGYSPLQIAGLFLFYEIFGVVTNLVGGYWGARMGLNRTMNLGLFLQVIALLMLTAPVAVLTAPWVMAAQSLSGIAKDLNKMSAKSAIKVLVPPEQHGRLFKWVALLTGSKNALKGMGFFLGGLLLVWLGFRGAIWTLACALLLTGLSSLLLLRQDLGRAKGKMPFRQIFATSRAVNGLSAARVFLFGARDIWFVVALPVFLATELQWDFLWVGGFLALWVVGYEIVQAAAPALLHFLGQPAPDGRSAAGWAWLLALLTTGLAVLTYTYTSTVVAGLCIFGVVFAINSAIHSYLIVHYAKEDGTSLDVGFYYMSNAMGRLIGTLLSGWIYQSAGLTMCLVVSAIFMSAAALLSAALPRRRAAAPTPLDSRERYE